jgi:hypothetical protein
VLLGRIQQYQVFRCAVFSTFMTAFREHGLESMVFALEYHMGERARVAPC